MTKRWAIYARYSTDMQRPSSIEDQVSLCREWVTRQGGTVTVIFADPELSGAHAGSRPEFQKLYKEAALADIRRFDGVVAEALDRLARNLGDSDYLRRDMEFYGVDLVTVQEGTVDLMTVGFKGTMNAQQLKDLAFKIKRGMKGNADRGLSSGGLAFGYKVGAQPGARIIDPDAAQVIIHIFESIAAGESARAIVRRLNAAGVPSPGKALGWRANTILGSAKRATGILRNEAYLGRILFGRQKRIRNPHTGKILMRAVPRAQWHVVERPEWRIVSDDLWKRAHDRVRIIDRAPLHQRRRPPRLLTGLVLCGLCGSPMIIRSKDAMVCSKHRDIGGCDHDRSIRATEVEERVLAAVKTALDQPDAVSEFVATYHAERERLRREEVSRRQHLEAKIAKSQRGLDGITRMAVAGLEVDALAELKPQWEAFKVARDEAKAELARLGEAPQVIRLNPQAPAVYRRQLDELGELLGREGPDGARAREIIRAMARQVKVYPDMIGDRRKIEMAGELRVMVALSAGVSLDDIVGSGGGS